MPRRLERLDKRSDDGVRHGRAHGQKHRRQIQRVNTAKNEINPRRFGSLRGLIIKREEKKTISAAHGKAVSFSRIKNRIEKGTCNCKCLFLARCTEKDIAQT